MDFTPPVGANSTVAIGSEVTLNFTEVTSAGSITVDLLSPEDVSVPGTLDINGTAMKIETSATFSGPATVTFHYEDADPIDEVSDTKLKVLKKKTTGGAWQDVTTDVRPPVDEIDAQVDSFSDFMVVSAPADFNFTSFQRGDANNDGGEDISDAVYILLYLFSTNQPSCMDALDCNDDGAIHISDAVFLLGYLFTGKYIMTAPLYPEVGIDPTPDSLGCESYIFR